ncbi:MAG: hypothetical protein ACLGIZ_01605 [Acidimicrobiia bacterium]|jgi:hypothetical protein
MAEPSTNRFDNRPAQVALSVVGAVFAVIGLAGLAGGLAAAPVYLVGGVLFTVRAFRSSSVELRADTVVLRSMVHTRRLRLDELASVTVRSGRIGLTGVDRLYLSFTTTSGGTVEFKEFNASRRHSSSGNVVRDACDAIDSRIKRASPL